MSVSEKQVVVVSNIRAMEAAEPLFSGLECVYANGSLPPGIGGRADCIVVDEDEQWVMSICLMLASSGCKRIRYAYADITQVEGDAIEWVRARINEYATTAPSSEPTFVRSTDEDEMRAATKAGVEALNVTYAFIGRFVSYPSDHARVAHTLWLAHTHAMDAWESTPRIAFLSPEQGSGKTRALEVSETIVPRPVEAINATPAYLFRRVSAAEGLPTILFDEIDTIFGPKAKDNEELRGILNAGHRRGAMAGRCVMKGKTIETEELPAYCAVAIAGLGALPDTILSRSVIVRMRRRAPGEVVQAYRRRVHAPEGNVIRDRLAAWAATVREDMREAWPSMPEGVEDRNADVWEALLAVADAAGGDWPVRAREAAVALVTDSKGSTPSLGVRLLSDLRNVFGRHDGMSTEEILKALVRMEEAPWSDIRGKPLDPRRLAMYLRPYGVLSKNIRLGPNVAKGYSREDLHDPWSRYLGPSHIESATTATPVSEKDSAASGAEEGSGSGEVSF